MTSYSEKKYCMVYTSILARASLPTDQQILYAVLPSLCKLSRLVCQRKFGFWMKKIVCFNQHSVLEMVIYRSDKIIILLHIYTTSLMEIKMKNIKFKVWLFFLLRCSNLIFSAALLSDTNFLFGNFWVMRPNFRSVGNIGDVTLRLWRIPGVMQPGGGGRAHLPSGA
jgi:hypothetical protein